ncbi:MAG: hypothetical protein NTV21_21080 [Planctomycetota bacterium]|nr:hypothetical protein [Planctomycetota bacterium]
MTSPTRTAASANSGAYWVEHGPGAGAEIGQHVAPRDVADHAPVGQARALALEVGGRGDHHHLRHRQARGVEHRAFDAARARQPEHDVATLLARRERGHVDPRRTVARRARAQDLVAAGEPLEAEVAVAEADARTVEAAVVGSIEREHRDLRVALGDDVRAGHGSSGRGVEHAAGNRRAALEREVDALRRTGRDDDEIALGDG